MTNVLAVMNAKGGVAKTTTSIMLAETLRQPEFQDFGVEKILLVDTDPQANMTTLLLGVQRQRELDREHKTLVDWAFDSDHDNSASAGMTLPLANFIQTDVSPIRNLQGIDLLPGSIRLAFIELEQSLAKPTVSPEDAADHPTNRFAERFRQSVANYDLVIIDCAPSLSPFSERWLVSATHCLSPMKTDYLSRRAIELFEELHGRARRRFMIYGKHVGSLVTDYRDLDRNRPQLNSILNGSKYRALPAPIKHSAPFQDEFRHKPVRSYRARYPKQMRNAAQISFKELMLRLQQ